MAELTKEDLDRIDALGARIVANVLDMVAPGDERVSLSDVALCSMACNHASLVLKTIALEGTDKDKVRQG